MRLIQKREAGKLETSDARERELLRQIAHGERMALEDLYLAYHRRLARFLSRLTARHDLIDEVVNDTFWIVWRKAGDFRGRSRVSTWLIGIAYRCALKSLQRTDAALPWEEATVSDLAAASAGGLPDGQELRDWVLRGLEHLPLDQRTTLLLAYYLGHSGEEIGEIMGCPLSTVKARLFHARVKLRNLLPALGEPGKRGDHDASG